MTSATVANLLETIDSLTDSVDYASVRQELSQLSLGDLMKLKEKLGAKLYDEVMFSGKTVQHKQHKRKFSRDNKNRPMEMSSKRPTHSTRRRHHSDAAAAAATTTGSSVAVSKVVCRDPRFDDLSGTFQETYFKQSYSFITDVRQREKQMLLRMLHKCKDPEKSTRLQQLITRMTQQEKAEQEKDVRKKREQVLKKKEKQLVTQGKKPFYLKKSEMKKLDLAEKFKQLEQTGKVTKYIVNKKKKNAKHDRKTLPNVAD